MRNCKLKNSPCISTTRKLVDKICNKYGITTIMPDTHLHQIRDTCVNAMQQAGLDEYSIRQNFLSDFELLTL